ncbi:MAG: hypothetical protein ACJ761_04605 [Chloroflexota bacterium]
MALTSIGLDIVLGLAQVPGGLRLSPLATAIGSPVSSVQAALRILLANRLVERDAAMPPRYRLAPHPAREELVGLATVFPEPAHAIGIALRANPSVDFAAVDQAGFVATSDPTQSVLAASLDATIARIRAARPDTPPVEVTEREAFSRLIDVSLGLESRLRRMIVLKGRLPRARQETTTSDKSADRLVI